MPDKQALAQTLVGFMGKRKKKLDSIEDDKKMGGIFDIIYRKKKEREAMLSQMDM